MSSRARRISLARSLWCHTTQRLSVTVWSPPHARLLSYRSRTADLPLTGVESKYQLEAAAGRRSEGLLGVLAEVVLPQPATGRGEWEGAATRHGRVGLMAGQQTRASRGWCCS